MKKCLIIALFFFFMLKSFVQHVREVGHDTYTYNGNLIRIEPSRAGGYGYAIYFKSHLVERESINPFSMAPSGLRDKNDVLKLACWSIDQNGRRPRAHATINQRM